MSSHRTLTLIIASLAALLPVIAQEKPAEKPAAPAAAAPKAPTNLKVLKVKSGAEVGPIMRTFTAALGVQCTYCHVEGNFASDENPKKITGRNMIQMTMELNGKFPDHQMHVTCFTCHRGQTEPSTAPEPKPGH